MKINCFGGKKGPENRAHVARCEPRIQSIKGKKKRKKLIFFLVRTREREGEKKKIKLFSTIYGVPSIGIRQDKNESPSTRRGLSVGTEKTGFHLGFK